MGSQAIAKKYESEGRVVKGMVQVSGGEVWRLGEGRMVVDEAGV